MRYGSVCSGISSATVACKPLGWEAAWFSEVDSFPSAVLAHHWPNVPNLGDMRLLVRRVLTEEIEAPDVLTGGTPCQAFSVAGMREGMADDRGQLTMKYVELADAIDLIRSRAGKPECITIWENVPGVLSDRENAFGCFLGALCGEDAPIKPSGKKWTNAGCVYGPSRTVAWRVLDAQYFGVAQRRRRVFVVSSARAGFDPEAVLFERDGVRRDTPPSREARKEASADAGCGFETAGTLDARTSGGGFPGTDGACLGHVVPVAFSAKDHGGDATYNLSPILRAGGHTTTHANAGVMPAVCFTQNSRSEVRKIGGDGQVTGALTAHPGAKQQNYLAQTVAFRGREGGSTAELRGEVATTLMASTGDGDKPHVMTVHGTQDPCVSDRTAFALGRNNGGENAVYAARQVAQTITQNYGKQPDNSDTALGPNLAMHGLAVRRLTPAECELLQGYPPGHTLIPTTKRNWHRELEEMRSYFQRSHQGLSDEELIRLAADGPRYKALGNSMAVPVMRWIARRINMVLGGEA